jgi:hypothetical protein
VGAQPEDPEDRLAREGSLTDAQIDAEVERIATRAREHLDSVRSQHEDDQDGLRLDTFALVCMWVWDDEDGDACEHVSMAYETKRRYTQEGLLRAALREHDMLMRGYYRQDDLEEDAE